MWNVKLFSGREEEETCLLFCWYIWEQYVMNTWLSRQDGIGEREDALNVKTIIWLFITFQFVLFFLGSFKVLNKSPILRSTFSLAHDEPDTTGNSSEKEKFPSVHRMRTKQVSMLRGQPQIGIMCGRFMNVYDRKLMEMFFTLFFWWTSDWVKKKEDNFATFYGWFDTKPSEANE